MKNLITAAVGVIVALMIVVVSVPLFGAASDSDILDIMIIDGQSNAMYGLYDLDVVNDELGEPSQKIYYYGTASKAAQYDQFVSWDDYSVRLAYQDGAYVVGSLIAPLGYYYSEKSHHDILIIDAGVGGSAIANLIPGATGGDWREGLIEHIMPEIPSGYVIDKIGWIWLQGESDTTTAISTYKGYFHQIYDYYTSIGYQDCYIVKIRYIAGGNATIAQNQLIMEMNNVYMGTDITDTFTGTDYMADGVHYSQAGKIVIGHELAEFIPAHSYGDSGTAKDIIMIIPMIIIAGLIVAVVALMVSKRYL